MFTIRQIIDRETEIKAHHLNISFEECIKDTRTCIIFYTKNRTKLFIDMGTDFNKLKNNTYRKIDIDIIEGDYKIPEKMWKYGDKWTLNDYALATFQEVPEKVINEFLSMNGGVSIGEYTYERIRMWENM